MVLDGVQVLLCLPALLSYYECVQVLQQHDDRKQKKMLRGRYRCMESFQVSRGN